MSPTVEALKKKHNSFPRVSGDEPAVGGLRCG